MAPNAASLITTDLIRRIRRDLDAVACIAKGGAACAEAGHPARAIDIVIEIGEDLHEVAHLLEAVLVLTSRER